jgi:hypothetical protein
MAENVAQSGTHKDVQHEAELLTAGLEPEVSQIIDTIASRVAEIEQQALREARELSERSDQGAREAASFALDRSRQVTGTLEVLAGTVTEMASELRTGVDAVLEALRGLQEAQVELPGEMEARPEDSGADIGEAESEGETPMDPRVGPSPELAQMFREQITMMRDDGKPRDEAKRVLKRYRWGRHFFGMLDEIYSPDESADAAGRGLIGKLRSPG